MANEGKAAFLVEKTVQSPQMEHVWGPAGQRGWNAVRRPERKGQWLGGSDHVGHCKMYGFYSTWSEKPLEDFCNAQEWYEPLTHMWCILHSSVNQVLEKMFHCHCTSWWDALKKTCHHFRGIPAKSAWPKSYDKTLDKLRLWNHLENNWLVFHKCQSHKRQRKE